eukprot:3955772-Amphidinium_carterae.2
MHGKSCSKAAGEKSLASMSWAASASANCWCLRRLRAWLVAGGVSCSRTCGYQLRVRLCRVAQAARAHSVCQFPAGRGAQVVHLAEGQSLLLCRVHHHAVHRARWRALGAAGPFGHVRFISVMDDGIQVRYKK